MQPKVAVIIVIWNGIEDTLECLGSLEMSDYSNKHIIIVDNGSTDGSAEKIAQTGLAVRLLRTGHNLGFTGGNNLGLAEAMRIGARYAFLLNNDTTLEASAISQLVNAAEQCPAAGIFSPVMHYYDEPAEIWFAGASVLLGRGEAQHDGTLKPQRDDPPYETEWVSGCAMLVNMRAVELVGGFDDRFYLTWEDVDWCLRMRKAHWKIAVVPPSRIYHKGGRSGAKLTGIRSYYAVRNSLLLAAKHGGLQYLSALVFVLGRHTRSALRSWRSEGPAILHTTLEGLWDHLRGRYGRRRSQLQVSELLKPLEPKDGVETFEGGEGCGLSK